MGAMAPTAACGDGRFGRVAVIVDEIESRQHPPGQQRVRAIDPGVEHRHPHASTDRHRLRLRQVQRLRRPLRCHGLRVADRPGHVAPGLGALLDQVGLGDQHRRIECQLCQHITQARRADDLQAVDRPRAKAADQRQRIFRQQRRQRVTAAQLDQHLARHLAGAAAAAGAATAGATGGRDRPGKGAGQQCGSEQAQSLWRRMAHGGGLSGFGARARVGMRVAAFPDRAGGQASDTWT